MTSNEVPSLQAFMEMIGGEEEYKRAVMLAAYLRTFAHRLDVRYYLNEPEANRFRIEIRNLPRYATEKADMVFKYKYLYLFLEESAKNAPPIMTNDEGGSE